MRLQLWKYLNRFSRRLKNGFHCKCIRLGIYVWVKNPTLAADCQCTKQIFGASQKNPSKMLVHVDFISVSLSTINLAGKSCLGLNNNYNKRITSYSVGVAIYFQLTSFFSELNFLVGINTETFPQLVFSIKCDLTQILHSLSFKEDFLQQLQISLRDDHHATVKYQL